MAPTPAGGHDDGPGDCGGGEGSAVPHADAGAIRRPERNRPDAICAALRDVTGILGASATVTYTSSGIPACAQRERPAAPILCITPQLATARRLALVWGVHSTISEAVHDESQMVSAACQAAVREGFAQGDQIAITAGMPFGQPGSTNLLRVAEVWG
jgi:pyruvate kinase